MKSCAVPGCGSNSTLTTDTDCTFHRLPRSLVSRMRWILALGPLPVGSFVCSRHFEGSMFMMHKNVMTLKPNSVPKRILASLPKDKLSPNLGGCSDEAGSSGELVACRVCLTADGRLYAINGSGLEDSLEALTGVVISAEKGFPRHLCAFCRAKLSKCAAFRDSCQQSTALLQTLLEKGPLKMNVIRAFNKSSKQRTNNLSLSKVFKFETNPFLEISPLIKTEERRQKLHEEADYTEVEYLESEDFLKQEASDDRECTFEIPIQEPEIPEIEVKRVKLSTEISKWKKYEVATENTTTLSKSDNDNSDPLDKTRAAFKRSNERPEVPKIKKMKMSTKISKCKKETKKPSVLSKSEASNDTSDKTRAAKTEEDLAFEKEFNFEIKYLSKEEQMAEKEERNRKSSSYTCDVCGRGYLLESLLMMHKSSHHDRRLPYKCDVCSLRFRRRFILNRHQERHRAILKCRQCGYISPNRICARKHYSMHKGARFTCPHCQKTYEWASSYYDHMRRQHPGAGGNQVCEECGETFKGTDGLRIHKLKRHRTKVKSNMNTHKCAVCDFAFQSEVALQRHLELSAGVSHAALWPCAACGESCGSDAARAAHAAEKHPTEQQYCKECDVTFSNLTSFERHMGWKHRDRARAPEPACVPQPRPQRPRRRRGTAQGPFVCEMCGKLYQSTTVLEYHMNVHLGLKPYKCPHCSREFANKLCYTMHMRVHTGEKPYQCEQCPMAFAMQGNYARHVKTVHLRKQAKCNLCGKVMGAASLYLHVRSVHMNIKYVRRKRDRTKKKQDLVTES